MLLVLAGLAAFIAAVIQRITGLGFVLVLIGPVVLVYGPVEGVTIGILLALVASSSAVPLVWRRVEWKRTWWLIWPGLLAAPLGALLVQVLPDAALLLLIAAMAYFALIAGWIPVLSASLTGRSGAVVAGAAGGFMHVASGLSGPALAAYAVGDKWEQRSFAASVQVIFVAFSAVSVALRGLPASP
ncbi:MAG: TSUP family transporter, partial [Microbacterium sp.]